ncbi:hypothetical protein BH11PLA1_BH11PLA1_22070 [soil metagenome]
MAEMEVIAALTQFGSAGLIGWMWLTERRGAAVRESQLTGAHEKLMTQERQLDVLVRALEDNTRALVTLEVGHRGLTDLLRDLGSRLQSSGAGDAR